MRVALNVYNAWRLWKSRKAGTEIDFRAKYPDEYATARYVEKLRERNEQ